jgi:hypothetical protein
LWTAADTHGRGPVWSRDGATLFVLGGQTKSLGGTVLEAYDGRAGLKLEPRASRPPRLDRAHRRRHDAGQPGRAAKLHCRDL